MPDETQVLFKSPKTGKVQPVPQESWEDQLAAGYTPVSHKVMYSTSGQRAMVPNEELRDYVKQGYQTTPKTQFEQNVTGTGDLTQGAGTAFVDTLKGMLPQDPTGGAPVLSKKFWLGDNTVKIHPSEGGIAQIGKEASAEYQRARGAGAGPLAAGVSAGVAGAASPLGVSNIKQMGQAEQGESGQILGESAAPAAVAAAAPLIGRAVGNLPTETAPSTSGISADTTGVAGRWALSKTGIPGSGYVGEKIGRLFGNVGTAAESEADIQAGLQQRRAAYAEMNEDFANRAKQQQADMQKRIAASEKRISAAEDARQKEITDWAKVDKINEADHQAFQDRMAEIEQERQKALADTEKLRTQHAQDLQQRGTQQAAMDAAHAQSLADIEKARQGDLAAQERLKLQHAEALNRRKGVKPPPVPPPNPFAGMTSSATPIGNAPLPPVPTGPASPAPVIRMGTGIEAEGLAAQPTPTPSPSPSVLRRPLSEAEYSARLAKEYEAGGKAPQPAKGSIEMPGAAQPAPVTGRPGGMTPPPTPMPEPEGTPLSRPTVGSQIAARNKTSILERGRTLYQPGEEPDLNNPVHAKIINDLQTRSGPALRTMAKNGDRFAAFVLRNMPRP